MSTMESHDEDFSNLQKLHFDAIQGIGNKRTAMGEYIVPTGGKPLTSLGDCVPGPADYSPKVELTTPTAPQYSVAGRPKTTKAMYEASPAEYNTSSDLVWPDRKSTIKGKGKMRPYDIRDDAHMNDSIGPLRYNIEHNSVGTYGPGWSISTRHKEGVNAGPPNALVQPVDTQGHGTPGPNYRPNSGYWGRGPKKSFGLSRKEQYVDNPGPADYFPSSPRAEEAGPAYSLAKRLPPPLAVQQAVNKESPGPGTYDLGTTIGKAQAKSISGRHKEHPKHFVPAPNMYVLHSDILNKATAKMTYRPFDPEDKPHPAPNNYTVRDTNLKKPPTYSIRTQTKPAFPDILNYPLIAQKHCTPGPGAYQDKSTLLVKNDKPKFSMGKRPKTPKNEVPGPNHYRNLSRTRPDAKTSPAFSMGSRRELLNKKDTPGPAAYYPQPRAIGGGQAGYSMSKRPKSSKKFATPAPNRYGLTQGQTNKGHFSGPNITFKSRASPYVYSGFRSKLISANTD